MRRRFLTIRRILLRTAREGFTGRVRVEASENACERTLPKPRQQRCRTFWKTPYAGRRAPATSSVRGVVRVSRLEPIGWPIPAKLPGTLADAAVAYAQAGVPVFPCVPGDKNPLIQRGFHRATTDLRQIHRWWRRIPEANIGIATGRGVEVLDVDVHAIGTGFPVLRSLRRSGQIDGWAQAVRSPAGGLHLYYPTDPAREQRSWARGMAHLDFRGLGGYILAPPSISITTEQRPHRCELIARSGC